MESKLRLPPDTIVKRPLTQELLHSLPTNQASIPSVQVPGRCKASSSASKTSIELPLSLPMDCLRLVGVLAEDGFSFDILSAEGCLPFTCSWYKPRAIKNRVHVLEWDA